MSLELRRSSKWWYGVFTVNGQRQVVNLNVPISGRRPPKRTMLGDDAFERSRGRALAEYDRRRREFEEDRNTESAIRKLVELKTGRAVVFPRLVDLPELWIGINRRRTPSRHYASHCQGILKRFAAFVAEVQSDATEFVMVTPETARAFLESETARGVSPTTWNYTLKLLRTTFRRLHPQLTDGNNPFRGFVTKELQTVGRYPFTAEELRLILDASTHDPFIRPVMVTGMCTAMRRGDCCLLRWKDVDFAAGFITVKTAKTGETVEVPMFPMLREELERARTLPGDSEFCFPGPAAMYQSNPDGITRRAKQVLARALGPTLGHGECPPDMPEEEIRRRGGEYLQSLGDSPKPVRMRAVLAAYLDGKNIDKVMAQTGCSRGTVSAYLNEIQAHIGGRFIRGSKPGAQVSLLQAARPNGIRRASVRDFHSFRVTWITLALAAGVPLELVQRVTGHRTVAVVMKHYFRPGREDFRQILNAAMPMLLTSGEQSPKDQIRALAQAGSARNYKGTFAQILQLVEHI